MLTPGSRFAHYEIEGVAGAGGSASVYRARDLRLDRLVALKLIARNLAGDPLVRERLNREAILAASVQHPNVVPVYEAGEHDGALFLARGWVEGLTLGEVVRRDGRLPVPRALGLLVQTARALQAVHDAGLVHRDLTPGNVLVDARDRAHLTDFGITRRATDVTGITAHDSLIGTIDYIAPEQIAGEKVGRPADIYSLGCLGWFLLCGEPPFPRDGHAAKLYAHLSAQYTPVADRRDDVPAAIDDLLREAMAKEPQERPASARELGERIAAAAALLDDEDAPLPPPPPPTATFGGARPPRRRRHPRARRALRAATAATTAGVAITAPAALYVALHTGSEGRTTFDLGRPAASVAALPGSVVVGDGADRSITRLDAGRNRRQVIVLGARTDRVATSGGTIYAAGGRALTVLARGGGAARRIPLASAATALAATRNGAWVALARGGLERVSAQGRTATVAGAASALAASRGVLWALDARAATVQRRSAATGLPLGPAVRLAGRPVAIAAAGGRAWVVAAGRQAVLPLGADGRQAGAPIPVAAPVGAIAADGRALWVLSPGRDIATRIDLASGRPAQTEGVPAGSSALAAAGGGAWVAAADGRVTRLPLR